MITTPAQFAELNKAQVDALYALSNTVFDATEKLFGLNIAAAKALIEESAGTTQSFLGVKDVQEFVALSGGLAQPTVEKFVSYGRNVYGIASGAGAEVTKIVETQVAEGNKKFADLIEFASKNAPAGSEPAVSMFKSAVAAANTAYDTMNKVAKQAVDMVESNVAAATSATMKAAAAANEVAKSKVKRAA